MNNSRIIFPLDVSNIEEARYYIKILKNSVAMFKIGLELFYKAGPVWVKNIILEENIKVFLDLKLHDIPNTVYGAVKNLLEIKPFFITVHLDESEQFRKFVYEKVLYNGFLCVTFLTSLDENDLHNLYIKDDISVLDFVLKKAEIAYNAKCRGVVCAASEANAIKKKFGDSLVVVTPGIRLKKNKTKDDQKRVFTPYEAIINGSDYLVIGRPIRTANDPVKICEIINRDVEKALNCKIKD